LLNIIGLLDAPSKGEIKISDQKTDHYLISNWHSSGIKSWALFSKLHLINDLQVLDNVELPLPVP